MNTVLVTFKFVGPNGEPIEQYIEAVQRKLEALKDYNAYAIAIPELPTAELPASGMPALELSDSRKSVNAE